MPESDVEVEANGALLVIDASAAQGQTTNGVLFRVDPLTGIRTALSDFADAAKGADRRAPPSAWR